MAEVLSSIEHPPRRPRFPFPGGEPRYRALRLRAAIACRNYNSLPEDAKPEERQAALRRILSNPDYGTPCGSRTSVAQSSPVELVPSSRSHIAAFPARTSTPPSSTTTTTADNAMVSTELTTAPPTRQHKNSHPGFGTVPLIKGPLWIDYGTNVHIDGTSFINRDCKILDTPLSELRIGRECSIGPDVHFYCVTHPLDPDERHNPDSKTSSIAGDIILGNRVWIGGGVKILPGVTIGDGCVIGAGSVVTKSMPPYVLAHGVPARIKRRIRCAAWEEIDPFDYNNAIYDASVPVSSPLLLTEAVTPKSLDEIALMEDGRPPRILERRLKRVERHLKIALVCIVLLFATAVLERVKGPLSSFHGPL